MRRTVRDNFDDMYVRSREAERYLPHADQSIVNDPDFKRTIHYICKRFVKSGGFTTFFLKNGFDEQDVKNVATFIGLTFNGRQAALDKNPRDFYLMIRFVAQRMGQFSQLIARKFNADDSIVVNSDIAIGMAEAPAPYEDTDEDEPEPFKGDRKLRINLRARLDKEYNTYADELCSYATAKYVSYELRQAARSACRRYSLDYKAWLMEKIEAGKLDKNDHCY